MPLPYHRHPNKSIDQMTTEDAETILAFVLFSPIYFPDQFLRALKTTTIRTIQDLRSSSFVSPIRSGHVHRSDEESAQNGQPRRRRRRRLNYAWTCAFVPCTNDAVRASNQYILVFVMIWGRRARRPTFELIDLGRNGTKSHESRGGILGTLGVFSLKIIGHFLGPREWNFAERVINRIIGRSREGNEKCPVVSWWNYGQKEEIGTGTAGGSDDQLRVPEWARRRQESSQNSWLGLLQHQFR